MSVFKVSTTSNLYDLNEKNPYKTLYISVILQAMVDVSKPYRKGEHKDITVQREEAHAWFFTSACEDFEVICYYAGIAPAKIRGFAYEAVKSGDTENVRRKFSSFIY